MPSAANVAMLVGSVRTDSLNRKTANALIALSVSPMTFEMVEIGTLPLYNQDLEGERTPAEWAAFREKIRTSDAFLFVTPEYNRSVPGVLKNALDVASRPFGQSAWDGKPGAIVSVSPGAIGGFGANHHLRQSLVFLNVPTMQQPEAYIGGAAHLFDAEGKLANESTRGFLEKFMASFAAWVEANRKR
jgi:chromate reductase, NAD(P)H dehydrogenase (quinone)